MGFGEHQVGMGLPIREINKLQKYVVRFYNTCESVINKMYFIRYFNFCGEGESSKCIL